MECGNLLSLSVIVLCFLSFLLTPSCEYQYEYGNVVSKPTTEQDPPTDIIKLISKYLSSDTFDKMIHYQEKLLYYSDDGATPTLLNYGDKTMCYSITVKIGVSYDVTVVTNHGFQHHFKIFQTQQSPSSLLIYEHVYYNHLQPLPLLCCNNIYDNMFDYKAVSEPSCAVGVKCSISESDWSRVTIATYNIWNINSTASEWHWNRIKRLAKVLSKYDIIGLQEVRSVASDKTTGQSVNQIESIAKILPSYQYIYQPGMLFSYNDVDQEGVAVLSRYPIISTEYILLPWNKSDPSDFHQRVCLQCTVLLPLGQTINVFVTHLSLSGSAQIRSVVDIYQYIHRFQGPSIFLGDLNCEPDTPPLRFLCGKEIRDSVLSSGMDDIWRQLEIESTGQTFCTLHEKPEKRIDYIFIKRSNKICLESTKIIGKGQTISTGLPLSDHFGLATSLRIKSI